MNPHALRHKNLNLACLPIPPIPHNGLILSFLLIMSEEPKFHEVISRTSGNPLLEKSLHKVFLESRKNHEQMNEPFGYETGLHYHTEILEAFKNHDAERARDVMEQHLGGSIETLKMSGKIVKVEQKKLSNE